LTWPVDKILGEVDNMVNEQKQIKFNLFKLAWFMRGGASISEMFESTHEDREIISDLIKENLKTAKDTGQPFW
jgi:hypothetical protein